MPVQQHLRELRVRDGHATPTSSIGTTTVLLLVGLFAHQVWRRFREPSASVTAYWIRVGAVTGLIAISLQEAVDFSLQIPANAALFAVLCGIVLGSPAAAARKD